MSALACPQETATRTAATTGRWTAAARGHLQSCPQCRDVAVIVLALAVSSDETRVSAADPGRLWIQGRVVRRVRAEAQVSRVVLSVHVAIGLACALLLGYATVRLDLWNALPATYTAAAGVFTAVCVAVSIFLMTRRQPRTE